MDVTYLINQLRQEIGDPLIPFRDTDMGDGQTSWVNLSQQNISPAGFQIQLVNGVSVTALNPATDYAVNWNLGQVQFTQPIPNGTVMIASGNAYGMFTDNDLKNHLRNAMEWHSYNRSMTERYVDFNGFIKYRDQPITLENIPRIEWPLVLMRGVINVMWTLANDAATEVNVSTGEGTAVNNGQLYSQLMEQIEHMTDRYKEDCSTLNVGPYRIEVATLRRVSQTTGRLVPVFKAREYDDFRYPLRELPPIDHQYDDNSGVPSQFWYGGGL